MTTQERKAASKSRAEKIITISVQMVFKKSNHRLIQKFWIVKKEMSMSKMIRWQVDHFDGVSDKISYQTSTWAQTPQENDHYGRPTAKTKRRQSRPQVDTTTKRGVEAWKVRLVASDTTWWCTWHQKQTRQSKFLILKMFVLRYMHANCVHVM